jgi:uncharacterized membrane protein YedE/YeeE
MKNPPASDAATIDLAAPDFECLDGPSAPAPGPETTDEHRPLHLAFYLLAGVYLGVVFVQSEVVSWFRIQEMFRFQSVHLYGIIGSAVAVAAASLWLIRRLDVRTLHGEPIGPAPKQWGDSRVPGARYWLGGTLFGLGWALIGACPGPIFALLGGGVTVIVVALVAALAGTWAYAALRAHLPH